jgi:hypothetical protein
LHMVHSRKPDHIKLSDRILSRWNTGAGLFANLHGRGFFRDQVFMIGLTKEIRCTSASARHE